MGVRTAERITGVSVFMADLQIGLQRSGGLYYSASRGTPERHRETAVKEKTRVWRRGSEGHAGSSDRRRIPSPRAQNKTAAPSQELSLIRGGLGLDFVGAGAVEARDGDIQEAKIYGELRAVMDVVVEHHAANADGARQAENFLASGEQPPILHYFGVADAGKCSARRGDVLVELGEQLSAIVDLRRRVAGTADGCVVEFFGLNRGRQPVHHGGHMAGQPPERAGLVVRLPIPFVFRTALEDPAGVLHFLIKFRQQRLPNGHSVSPSSICDPREGDILGEQKTNCQGGFATLRAFVEHHFGHPAGVWGCASFGEYPGRLGEKSDSPRAE